MDKEFVTVATYPDLISAQYYRSLLEENGLHAFLPGEFSVGTQLPGIVFTTHGLRLQVPTSEAEQALQILQKMAERGAVDDEALNLGSDTEPSEAESPASISSERHRMALLIGGLILLGLALMILPTIIRWLSPRL